MELNNNNYFAIENRQKYMSVSQFKDFRGSLHKHGCEASAMANINSAIEEEPSDALLIGSYVDAHFEGTIDDFKAKKENRLTPANLLKAENAIKTAENDELFMKFMSGKKQVVMTANLFGCEWKIKMDSYIEDIAIVDLKVMASLKTKSWSEKEKCYVNFIDYWGYDIQGAIYQEIVFQNTGKRLPFYIAAISKETCPDKEIIAIPQDELDRALGFVRENIDSVIFVKNGGGNLVRCENCEYCRSTKVLTAPIWSYDLKF